MNHMKIALIGYGKMGKEIERIALQRGHTIVSVIDKDNRQDFDSEAFRNADVAIEFTAPTAAYDNCMKAFAAGVKVVSGSTGWMSEHGEEMERLCREEGRTLFWASNFSIGVAIFSAVNNYLARIMDNFPGYDVSMSETHHVHKLDAPSGTAITLAEGILENLKRMGYAVKLDTNGSFPDKLKKIVEEGLVDYVAMDVKNSRENYGRTIGIEGYDTRNVEKSVGYLLSGAVDYEFRTTVVREFHQRSDFEAIGRWIKGAKRYYLQQFQDSGDLIRPGLHAYNDNIMRQALDVVKAYVPSAELRGI